MAGNRLKLFAVAAAVILLLPASGWSYFIYLKNGETFKAVEHREERGLFIVRLLEGYEIGIPRDELDWEKTRMSILKQQEMIRAEEDDRRRRSDLEQREKKDPQEIAPSFVYEKRGMQLVFAEDEARQLIDIGEKNHTRVDEILAPYSFFYDYIPSIVYTKRLRIILYGAEKGKSRRPVVTTEVQNITQDPHLLILLGLTGNDPDHYRDVDIYLEQDGKKIRPYNFKLPSKGERTAVWPQTPSYVWKVLLNFSYADFDLSKQGRLIVKKEGLYREFTVDFPSYR